MKTNKKILILLLAMTFSFVIAANTEAYLGSSTRKLLQYKNPNIESAPEGAPAVSSISSSKGVSAGAAINAANTFLGVTVGPDGKFNMGANLPTPWDLLFNWPFGAPWSSFTTVQIDGTNYVYGETAPGTWVQTPADVTPTKNISAWQIAIGTGAIIITQTLEIVSTASSTGNEDVLKVQYTVQNTDAAPHTVGVRALMDTEVNYDVGVAVPFRLPLINDSFTTELQVLPPIPPYYQAFGDLYDTIHVAQGTLTADGATAPDVLQLASWPDIYDACYNQPSPLGNCFDYTITPLFDITGDSAVALYWNPAALASAASRTYITYYGIGGIQACPDPLGISVGVSGPAQVGVDSTGCVPANPTFTIVGYVQNDTGADLAAGETLTLTLPACLTTADPLTQTAPIIPNASIWVTSWNVAATAACTDSYSVTEAPGAVACSGPVLKPFTIMASPGSCPCTDADADGYFIEGGIICGPTDCDDANAAINPGAPELCNGIDDNCNGVTDEGCPVNTCNDGFCNGTETCATCPEDCGTCPPVCGDGFCSPAEAVCAPPPNDYLLSVCPEDCGVCTPVCGDGICNDEEDCTSCPADCPILNFYPDADADNFGDELAAPTPFCIPDIGFADNNLDCDDNNVAVNPDAIEVCNGIDDNCNGQIDEGCPTTTIPTTTVPTTIPTTTIPTTTIPTTTVPTTVPTTIPTTTIPTTTVPTTIPTTTTTVPSKINVYVDIKPGSCPNSIVAFSKANVPIAILGTADFDVNRINPDTIRLIVVNGTSLFAAPPKTRSYEYTDAATPFTGELCGCTTLRADGYTDLVLYYRPIDLQAAGLFRYKKGETATLMITGALKAEYGSTPIEGKDCILVGNAKQP